MTVLATILLLLLLLPLAGTVFRMLKGPGVADRFVALDMLTGIAVAAAALTAVVTDRREFMDVGFGLAVFGFVGTVALSAFLARKERKGP